jgi:hypothetical protein
MRNSKELMRNQELVDQQWILAWNKSRYAEPNDGFADRLRAIAEAAESQADSLAEIDENGSFVWTPRSKALRLSHELRRGANRPGTVESWDKFDATVDALNKVMEGKEFGPIAQQFGYLADILFQLADEVDEERARRASRRERSRRAG